jgi:hypothetical protein
MILPDAAESADSGRADAAGGRERDVNVTRNRLTPTPVWGRVAHVIDRTVVPYLAGFVLCVGSVLALAACTSGGDGGPEPTTAAIAGVAGVR